MDTEARLVMVDPLQATASLAAGGIDLTWACRTSGKASARFRLLRRLRSYPVHPDRPGEPGVCVVDLAIPLKITRLPDPRLHVVEVEDPDTGDTLFRFSVKDTCRPEIAQYYALFEGADDRLEALGRDCAVAAASHGLAEGLYRLLPAVHRALDEPAHVLPGRGDLRRFAGIFGVALDYLRSGSEGLRNCQDILEARPELLPHFAQWIGWDLDLTADIISQRMEILFAPELYRTVGTIPNLRGVINRFTGWDCRIKEFADNVCRTNAPERLHLWELWESSCDPAKYEWSEPAQQSWTDAFDGRPACFSDSRNILRLLWPSQRSGESQLWYKRADEALPVRLTLCPQYNVRSVLANVSSPSVTAADDGTLLLFFDAGEPTRKDVWVTSPPVTTASLDASLPEGPAPFPAINLSDHPKADDRNPCALVWQGKTWVFWQSDRRGPTDIWARVYDGQQWGAATRITRAKLRHHAPAAVATVDGILLFYCEDSTGRSGSASRIVCQRYDGQSWGPQQPVTQGPQDQAPAAVLAPHGPMGRKVVRLFWHAPDGDGHWQIFQKIHDVGCWSVPTTLFRHPAADKDPAAVYDASRNKIRLFWHSQRRGYFRINGQPYGSGYPVLSCTVDTNSPEMMADVRAGKGWFGNSVHYTYDTGAGNDDWCRRDTVGVYVSGAISDPEVVEKRQELVRSVCRKFLPIQVRVLLIVELLPYQRLFQSTSESAAIGGHLV